MLKYNKVLMIKIIIQGKFECLSFTDIYNFLFKKYMMNFMLVLPISIKQKKVNYF